MKKKIDDDIATLKKEQKREQKKLDELQKQRELIDQAPTVKEQRSMIAALYKANKFSPIEELLKLCQKTGRGAPTATERISILKELASYEAPKPKSVDIQADMKMNVSVSNIDFSQTTQALLKTVTQAEVIELENEAYDEFKAGEEE